jgi:hypothetical protein
MCLAFTAGCSTLDVAGFLSLNNDRGANEHVVAGSFEAVAQSTQSTLQQMGFAATLSRSSETIRIASKTSSGKGFTVVLSRSTSVPSKLSPAEAQNAGAQERTSIRIEWDGEGDQQTGLQLLAQIDAAAKR